MSALQNFRAYDLSIEFYRDCKQVKLPYFLRDQLLRAASSIPLNLSEGSAKPSRKDRLRYYKIAFGSLRGCQAIVHLEELENLKARAKLLGAMLYKLTRS